MKHVLTHVLIACGLSLAAADAAQAQAQPTSTGSTVETVLPTEIVGSTEPTPEAPAAARREAYAALAVAQRDCRKESANDARRDCMTAARQDFHDTLARAGIGS